ncbi:MAG: hypothetical protein JXB85_17900 [Anaerolineales bacterium]|nr:hypothetical protein [Anaerolineales bacterium]
MSFFKKLGRAFTPPSPKGKFHNFKVRCKRCGEIISGQVNIFNDPSLEFDEKDKQYYVCRKVLIGSGENLCFQQIEVIFRFDEPRRVIDRQIIGGEFVDEQAT